MRRLRSLAERFWPKVDRRGPDDCWFWLGAKGSTGYGQICAGGAGGGRRIGAHSASYELSVGPIPAGLILDHLCRHRDCVNPAHLEPVTMGENTRRGTALSVRRAIAARRTHCGRGHRFTERDRDVRGGRMCRRCQAAAVRRWREQNRARVNHLQRLRRIGMREGVDAR